MIDIDILYMTCDREYGGKALNLVEGVVLLLFLMLC